jgi:hypothetical protein
MQVSAGAVRISVGAVQGPFYPVAILPAERVASPELCYADADGVKVMLSVSVSDNAIAGSLRFQAATGVKFVNLYEPATGWATHVEVELGGITGLDEWWNGVHLLKRGSVSPYGTAGWSKRVDARGLLVVTWGWPRASHFGCVLQTTHAHRSWVGPTLLLDPEGMYVVFWSPDPLATSRVKWAGSTWP